jgi:stage II sporulation SpoAA-like protein
MDDTTAQAKHYKITQHPDYINLAFQGVVNIDDLHDSTDDIVRIAQQQDVYKLLDDIRELDRSSVTIQLQTESIGLLWHLKIFKRIALVYKDGEIGRLVKTTLETVPFLSKCRAFDNEAEAIAWLQQE